MRSHTAAHSLTLADCGQGADESDVRRWCIPFIALAVVNFFGSAMRLGYAYVAGERLTFRLRRDTFAAIVRQRPRWFDEPAHGSIKLAHRLAADASQVRAGLCFVCPLSFAGCNKLFLGAQSCNVKCKLKRSPLSPP
jgi:ABC-type multidrug transport system fused ATPase/permease subunit